MTISVVIPAYNEEKFLPATLASLARLTRKPDEIIVINARSTDATGDIAKAAGARVIEVIKETIGASRQRGLEEARSDVVVFTDADTVVPVEWLSEIEKMLVTPGVVAAFGGFRVPDGPFWFKTYINVIQPVMNTLFWRLLHFPMATGQYMGMYREKAIEAGGFPKEFKIAEDVEIARRLMRVGKIIFRQDSYVWASGRRGHEGFWPLVQRLAKAFFLYFIFRRADKVGFPDIRQDRA